MRLIDYFDRGVEQFSTSPFLLRDGDVLTYGEAQARSQVFAHALRENGVASGSRIAVIADNSFEAVAAEIGIIRNNCAWVAASPGPLDEAILKMRLAQVDCLIFDEKFRNWVDGVMRHCQGLVIALSIQDMLRQYPHMTDTAGSVVNYGDPSIEEVATIGFTGGTTGEPKCIMKSHLAWENMILGTMLVMPHGRPVHLMYSAVTDRHGGMLFLLSSMGAAHVLLDRFEPRDFLSAIPKYEVTHAFVSPTALQILLSSPDAGSTDFSSLTYLLYGGAPLSGDVLSKAFETFGDCLWHIYAQAEVGNIITVMSSREHREALSVGDARRLRSCGRAGPTVRVEVVDEDGHILPANVEGEVIVKSNQVHGAESKFVGSWHSTGDIGLKDEDGYLYLVDRKKDIILCAGTTIFPAEIEAAISGSPLVQSCVAFGIPHRTMGEMVRVAVVLRPGANASAEDLWSWCRQKLPRNKIPGSFEFRDQLPLSQSGKVLRKVLREEYLSQSA